MKEGVHVAGLLAPASVVAGLGDLGRFRIKKALKKGGKLTGVASEFKVSVSTLRRNVPDYAAFLRAA